jgi:hypothetical protein
MGNCCELFAILFFLKGRYKTRFKKQIFIPLCIILTILQFLNTNIFLAESQFVLLGSFLFTIGVILLYKIKSFNVFLFSIFICLANALSEATIAMLHTMVYKIELSSIQENTLLFAVCTLTSKFLTYIIILATKKLRFKDNTHSLKQNIVLFFSLPVASFLVMMLFLRCCYQINDLGFHIITFTTSIVLIFSNLAVFHIVEKQSDSIETKEKLLYAEKHINSQITHYEELYKHQSELRTFRHDIKNRLIAIIGLLKESKTEKAIQIIEKNLNWIDEKNDIVVNSGNPIIDAILHSKICEAKDKDISISIFSKLTEKIKIDEIELAIVLGNALDNAIEAVEKIIEKDKNPIKVSLITTQDRISISISNTVKEHIDIAKLQTTKNNKEKHGYGIKSIKAIAQKYDGMVLFSCEEKIFTVNINLANRNR